MSPEAEADFLTGLMNRLEAVCLRTLIVEIQYCKAGGVLGCGDSAEQYEEFVEGYLRNPDQMISFWQAYPYLYEVVLREVERYADFVEEILGHFGQDRNELADCFGRGENIRRISRLWMDRGDIHSKGRSVAEMELEGRIRIFYKPGKRNLKEQFTKALNVLYEKQGLSAWPDRMILKEDHTWEAAVTAKACTGKAERFRCYRRLGTILLLCYQWGVCDIHCENVIFHGEFPVPVDVEVVQRQAKGRKMKWGLLNTSVLSTGILPCYMKGAGENRVNPGVLCLDSHQKSSVRHLVLKNPKTSDICLELDYTELLFSNGLPKWTEEEETAVVSSIREGFRKAGDDCRKLYSWQKEEDYYERYCELKEKNCGKPCSGQTGGSCGSVSGWTAVSRDCRAEMETNSMEEQPLCRYIHRPTNEYAMLLYMLRHPRYLSGREAAEKMLRTALARPGNGGVESQKVTEWETECLLKGEIPLFSFYENSRRLYCGEEFIEDFFADLPQKESYGEHLTDERMSEKNLMIQEELIEVSMAGLTRDLSGFINDYGQKNLEAYLREIQIRQRSCPAAEDVNEWTQTAVEKVIQRISDMAFREGDRLSWWSVDIQFRDKVFWDVADMPLWLYQGKAGVSLFLHNALLCGISDSEEAKELADCLDRTMFEYTDRLLPKAGGNVFGAMSGEYSIVYYYQYLYERTGQRRYLDYARRHLDRISGKEPSEGYDLMYGSGGMALIWMNQWQLTGEYGCLGHAEEMLGRLEDFVKQQTAKDRSEILPGMAHGWSGVLLAFQRYALLTGSRRYDNVMIKIIHEENKWYRPEMNNWEDVHRGEPRDTAAWCHGAAGILLCRMELMKSRNREIASAAERDAKRAAAKIRSMPLRRGYCLCHGNLGNVSILRKYAESVDDRDLEKLCADYIRTAAEQFCDNTMKLLPQEKYDFGLMNGLCGMGAAFLDDTEFVTDILTLQIRKR